MNYPQNFSKGDIDEATFRKTFEAAVKKRSRLSITQTLKHSGIPVERAEEYADQFLAEGKKARKRANRPHLLIGWLGIILGIISTLFLLATGWVASITLIITLAGIYWVYDHRD